MIENLTRAGELLYGPTCWKAQIARDLGVAPRTVASWIAGERRPPADLDDRLVALMRDRAGAIETAIREFRK